MAPQTSSLLQNNGTTSRVDVCQSDFEPSVVQSDSVVCPGQCVTLAQGTPTGPTLTFSAPGAQPEAGVLDESTTLCFPGEGLYTISINAGACARTSVQVRVRQLTPEAFTLSDSVICPGACVGIVDPMLSDSFSYVWEFPGAVSDTVVSGPVPPFEVCYATAGLYTLQLSIEGCGSTSVPLEVSSKPYAVPNAFTPDGDNVNDVFVPLIECPSGPYQLSIYNRWGQKVFTSDDLAQGWDGTQNGSPSASDVYVWTLEFEDVQADGQVVRRAVHGDVTLIR
jgi:gliding motility-associated-like protein